MAAGAASLDRFGADVYGPSVPDITADSAVLDISMHPLQDVCAFGSIEGSVEIWKYGERPVRVARKPLFKSSCRALCFSADGNRLFCASKGGAIVSLDATGAVVSSLDKAHTSPITRMHHFAAVMLATGDEDGSMAVWDMRVSKPVMTFEAMAKKKHFEDAVSAMHYVATPSPTLLATSTDGTLAVVDLRTGTVAHRSEQIHDELLSLAVMKNGHKVVAGTLEQGLAFFTWGKWAEPDDRFSGLPDSIERIFAVTQDVLLAGCGDGTARLLQVQPHADIKTVAELGDNAVEAMEPSRDGKLLALSAQEPTVSFVDIADVVSTARAAESAGQAGAAHGDDSATTENGAAAAASSSSSSSSSSAAGARGTRGRGPGMGGADFFADL